MVAPLPNGQTMITFVDVTASDQVERALRDRNEALMQDRPAENALHPARFLRAPHAADQHLRLYRPAARLRRSGRSTRQSEYVDHIASSSDALMLIVDDILDLATIDAGIMELEFTRGRNRADDRRGCRRPGPAFRRARHRSRRARGAHTGSIVPMRRACVRSCSSCWPTPPISRREDSTVTFACEREEGGVVFKVATAAPAFRPRRWRDLRSVRNRQAGPPSRRRASASRW